MQFLFVSFHIFEFRHVFEGFISSLGEVILSCILLITYEHSLLSFLAIYFQINLLIKD
jgi:hypothetical protein